MNITAPFSTPIARHLRRAVVALCCVAVAQAFAQQGATPASTLLPEIPPREAVPPGAGAGQPDTAAVIEARKSHAIPALEIIGFDFLLNRVNRRYSDDYNVTGASQLRRGGLALKGRPTPP
jgi:hypothetical protein